MRTLMGLALLGVFVAGCTGGKDDGPAKGTVSITVTEDGVPRAGAHVLFHSKSGKVIERMVTASGGTATFDGAHLDGMATVFAELLNGGGEITSIAGLADGDDFEVNLDEETVDLGLPVGEPDVLFGPFAGAADYLLDVGCSNDATVATNGNTTPIYATCLDASGDADLMAIARDADDLPLAYAFVEGFPVATTNSVLLPAWSSVWTDASVDFTGLPSNALAALIDLRVRGRAGAFGLQDGAFATTVAGAAAVGVPVPQGFGGGIKRLHAVLFGTGLSSIDSASIVFEEETALTPDVTLPFATEFLPSVGIVENVSEDQTRPQVEWVHVELPGIDVAIVGADWDGADLWTWGFLVPPDFVDGSIRFPELPEDLAAMLPAIDPVVELIAADADFVDGFEEVKALQDLDLENPGFSPAKTKATIGGSIF